MPTANVDLQVAVTRKSELANLQKNIAQLEKKLQNVKTTTQQTATITSKQYLKAINDCDRAMGRLNDEADESTKKANQAAGAWRGVGKALFAIGAARLTQSIISTGVESIESARRLKALAGAFDEVTEAENAAARAAKKFGLSGAEANRQFAQIYARLRPLGIEIDQIESAFNGFNTAARLSGSTANESAAAWLQLSQALGSGALRGEELNSVFEQTPTVIQGIAREMNVPIGQVRDLAKEGQITSDIILRALRRLETEGVDQLAESLKGPRQRFKDFNNTVTTLSDALAVTVLPDLTDAIDQVGQAILLLEGPIKFISGLLANALRQVNLLIQEITLPAAAAARRNLEGGGDGLNLKNALTFGDPKQGLKELFGEEQFDALVKQAEEYAKLRNQSVKETFKQLALDRLEAMDGDSYIKGPLKQILKGTGNGTGDGNGNGKKSRTSKERLTDASKYTKALEEQQALMRATSELEKELLRIENQRVKELEAVVKNVLPEFQAEAAAAVNALAESKSGDAIGKALGDQLNDAMALREEQENALRPLEEQEALLRARLVGKEDEVALEQEVQRIMRETQGLDKAKVRDQVEVIAGLEKEVEQMMKLDNLAQSIADVFANSMKSAIKGLIQGTKSMNDVLSDMLGKLADLFLNMAFSMAGDGLGTMIGNLLKPKPRAMGGPVNAGQPYLVGEQGPELVVPAASGNVISSNAFSDATRALASGGGAVSGDGAEGTSAAFTAAAGANQVTNNNRTMMRSERFHSEQAVQMANPSPIKVAYESTVINSQSYVTEEQFQKGMNQTANRARSQTMRDFRNKPASRKMAGVN